MLTTLISQPYLYDVSRKAVVTFDDPASMAKKGALAKSERIGGILMVSPREAPSAG